MWACGAGEEDGGELQAPFAQPASSLPPTQVPQDMVKEPGIPPKPVRKPLYKETELTFIEYLLYSRQLFMHVGL